MFRSSALWYLGFPEAALRDADHALNDAREMGQAATLMFALFFASFVPIFRPDNELFTGRREGRLYLRSFLSVGDHFLPGEQTLHLDVVKAIGRCCDAGDCACRSGIDVEDHHRAGTLGDSAVHGNQLATGGGQHFLDRFAAVRVWVFGHSFERLWRVVRSETEQH